MGEVAELHRKLHERLLADFQREYADQLDTWRALEGKAQVLITVSAIFLAAGFAFARDVHGLALGERLLLCVSIVLLVVAVCIGLFVFRIVRVVNPPLGTFTESGVIDLARKSDDEIDDYLQRFVVDQATQWREAINSLADVNDKKATAVWKAQVCLGIAIGTTALFTLVQILAKGWD